MVRTVLLAAVVALVQAGAVGTATSQAAAPNQPVAPAPAAGATAPVAPQSTAAPGLITDVGTAAGPLSLAIEAATALRSNPSITQAVEKLQASLARMNAQMGLHYPQYNLSTTATLNKASGLTLFPMVATVLSLPFDTTGRNGQLIRQSRADLSSVRRSFQRAEADLVFQVSSAYYAVLRADSVAASATDAYTQAQAQQDAAQKRFDAGDAPRTDILKAQVQVAQAHSDLLSAQNDAAMARSTLNNLAGRALEAPVTLAAAQGMTEAPDPAALQARLESASPEIGSAQDAVTSADAALALARANGKPTFSFEANHTYTRDPTTYPHILGAGVVVSIPLPDGGVRRSLELEARAALDQARAALEITRRQASLDYRNAVLSLSSARLRVESTSQGVILATESLRASNLGYANDVSTARDVIDAQVALRQARIQNAQATYDYNAAVARLYSVLGEAPPGVILPPAPVGPNGVRTAVAVQ